MTTAMPRALTIDGTSWAQREALRALARACQRAGGPIPLRKIETRYEARVGKLLDRELIHSPDSQPRRSRSLTGGEMTFEERLYEPTATGRALLDRTADESPPPPAPLRDEHRALLALLAGESAPRTAASIASHAGLTSRQAGQRLSLLSRHGYVTDERGGYMQPTRWYVTTAGLEAHAARTREQED